MILIPTPNLLPQLLNKCRYSRSINPTKQVHCLTVELGFTPVRAANTLLHLYITFCDLTSAFKLFDRMPVRDTVSFNTLLFGLAVNGHPTLAESLFLSTPRHDLVSWNSLSSSFLLSGDALRAASLLSSVLSSGLSPDACTLSLTLKACSSLLWPRLGSQVHSLALRLGLGSHPVAASALVDMYAKSGNVADSLEVFARASPKSPVVWSAAMGGCVRAGDLGRAVELFRRMQSTRDGGGGGTGTQSIYATLLWGCGRMARPEVGRQVHCHSMKIGLGFTDVIVETASMDMYIKCGRGEEACGVFEEMPVRNRRSYNAMIVGRGGREGLELFRELGRTGLGLDEVSISGSLRSCCPDGEEEEEGEGVWEGVQIHGMALKKGMWGKVVVANAGVDMYGKCGAAEEARRVFDEMGERDVVSWNALMAASERNEGSVETLSLFVEMVGCWVVPDEFTYGSVLKACSASGRIAVGREVHGRTVKSGLDSHVFVSVGLVDMYCKCGVVQEAMKVHWGTEGGRETAASWNAIISGLSSEERSEEAHEFFSLMLKMKVRPDGFTFAAVLDASADLAAAGLGAQLHCQIVKRRLQTDLYISSTLLDMYSKCGNLPDARLVFDRAPARDFVAWNAMISSFAQHGMGEEAVGTYARMVANGIPPNHSTFVSVLRACGHMGMFEEARRHLASMQTVYGINPRLEHYSCMVDVVGRAGRVEEALRMVERMGEEADTVMWRTLLNVCNLHGDVRVGEMAVRGMMGAGVDTDEEVSGHVLLCNMYARVGRWEEVGRRREGMRGMGMKKEPGCSWIERGNEVHVFLVGDVGHRRYPEMSAVLALVREEMRRPETDTGEWLLS